MHGSTMLEAGFLLLSLAVLGGVVWTCFTFGTRRLAIRAALGSALWAALTLGLATTGVLADFSLPPRLPLLFVPGLMLTFWFARVAGRSGVLGAPQVVLVGLQTFRFLVELLIHRAVLEGVAPPQMTWPWLGSAGLNPDILTALTAPLVVVGIKRGWVGRRGLLAWNALGLTCLTTVVSVAVLSMPTPFQQLTPDNVWVGYAPYIWLPSLMVTAALWLHLLSLAKLLRER